jgi:hypothetical protein
MKISNSHSRLRIFQMRFPRTSDGSETVVVAVMGVTGVEKSTFIQKVSGRDDVIVGNSLSSGG